MAILLGGGVGCMAAGWQAELKGATGTFSRVWNYPSGGLATPFQVDETQMDKVLEVEGVGRLLKVFIPSTQLALGHLLICYDDYRILVPKANRDVLISEYMITTEMINSQLYAPVLKGQIVSYISSICPRQLPELSGIMIGDERERAGDSVSGFINTLFYYNGLYFKKKLTLYAAVASSQTAQIYMTWEEFKR